jgi:predicted anti-sigma-YlaC factor YlaD
VKRLVPLTVLLLSSACSIRARAIRAVGDAVSASGDNYASDDDPELVRAAIPFGLKTMEGLLGEQPDHVGLLTAACSGFTQYGYAFVQQDADLAELSGRTADARALSGRARRLYLRARDYGLRGLSARHAHLGDRLLHGERDAVKGAEREDVPLLYWTAASWALAISTAKDRMDLVGQLPMAEAMARRALELDEGWDQGALHEFFVSFEAGASGGGGPAAAKKHLDRALELSHGKKVGVLVSYAEAVSVQAQDRAEFKRLLNKALELDVDTDKPHRLANLIAQRRARMLLEHADDLFL